MSSIAVPRQIHLAAALPAHPMPPLASLPLLNLTPSESRLVCPQMDTEPQEPGRTDSTQVAGLGNCRAHNLLSPSK